MVKLHKESICEKPEPAGKVRSDVTGRQMIVVAGVGGLTCRPFDRRYSMAAAAPFSSHSTDMVYGAACIRCCRSVCEQSNHLLPARILGSFRNM